MSGARGHDDLCGREIVVQRRPFGDNFRLDRKPLSRPWVIAGTACGQGRLRIRVVMGGCRRWFGHADHCRWRRCGGVYNAAVRCCGF